MTASTDRLSIIIGEGFLTSKCSSLNSVHIQRISFPAATEATYLALVDERATVAFFLLDQLTAPIPILITYPLVEHQVSIHPAWSEAVGGEGVRKGRRLVRMVGEFEIHSPFEVSEDMLNSLPMSSTRVGVELCKFGNRVCNVGASANSKVHESTNCIHVRYFIHLFCFLFGHWA